MTVETVIVATACLILGACLHAMISFREPEVETWAARLRLLVAESKKLGIEAQLKEHGIHLVRSDRERYRTYAVSYDYLSEATLEDIITLLTQLDAEFAIYGEGEEVVE